MARRQPNHETPEMPSLARVLESIASALQQQGVALMQQHETALQQLEVARLNSEASEKEHVEALRQLAENGTHVEAQPQRVQEWTLENFLQHRPAIFNGKTSPDEADIWIRNMEKIFEAKRCPPETRLAYSEYHLSGEAVHWWNNTKLVLEESGEIMTWEIFKSKFYAEYFTDNVRHLKEVEFLQLVQGNKSVAEYADMFKHLVRFYTQPSNEKWRCRKEEWWHTLQDN